MTVMGKGAYRFACGLALLACSLTVEAWAQNSVVANQGDRQLPVIDMKGDMAVVLENGEPTIIADGRFSVLPADRFTDGAIHIKAKDAYMGQDYGSARGGFFFRFVAEVEAERDFEDCFALFMINPEDGSESIILREIRDVSAGKVARIDISFPQYSYFFFSKGESIEVIDPHSQVGIRTAGPQNREEVASFSRRAVSEDALPEASAVEVTKTVYPDYPEVLQGTGASGQAVVIFAIGVAGEVAGIVDMSADNGAFLGEARRAILESEYEPAYYDGKPLPSTAYQEFTFNELVVFPGKLQMVPYPEIEDRNPVLVHAADWEAAALQGKLKVEVLVDRFGKVSEFRALESTSDEATAYLEEQSENWVFLPAIADGVPTERRLRFPIEIGGG